MYEGQRGEYFFVTFLFLISLFIFHLKSDMEDLSFRTGEGDFILDSMALKASVFH